MVTADAEAEWKFEREAMLSKGKKIRRFKSGRGQTSGTVEVKNGQFRRARDVVSI